MIRHLLRLAWNRKTKNALLSVELLISFLVLLVVMTIAVAAASYIRVPLGFDYHDVMVLDLRDDITGDDTFSEEQRQRVIAMIGSLRAVPGILNVSGALAAPMGIGANSSRLMGARGAPLSFRFDEVTDEFLETMDIPLVAGRWFGPEDDASPDRPVVINRRLALEALGDPAPIGKDLLGDQPLAPGERRMRVVGVVEDYRSNGELGLPVNFLFHRKRLDDASARPASTLLLEFDPVMREGLEKRIEDTARVAAPGWGLTVKPLSEHRTDSLRLHLVPLLAVTLVAQFLLAMVALGLSGVFWQSIAQRRTEIGLRRAAGATARGVVVQIVGEVFAMVTLVVAVGLLLALQLPLFGLARLIGVGVFVVAVAAAVVLIYVLAGLAALAPAALAARVQPADALRTE